MAIFGTIGIFVKYIPMPSSVIASIRGLGGMLFLLLLTLISGKTISKKSIKKNLPILLFSGAFIGINWILLFESYRYTSVATATLCYYLAPVIVILLSPLVLKEKLTLRKLLCVLGALVGMFFVSGVAENGIPSFSEIKGVLLGIGAAAFYATVIMLNKKLKDIESNDRTLVQLGVAGAAILPYALLTENISEIKLDTTAVILLAVVAIVHTGISYVLYFGSIKELSTQTVAIFSYIDPIVAILLSALFLKESMTVYGVIGAVLILGSTLISELPERKKIK
ncbi:MAG: EamA family transporter [Clostridia bacterium]|nr:EamA family transporter [Clostridia bacterium]